MRKNICLGLGATLAFVVSVYAQEYKINKVGSNDEQSFNILLNQIAVTQAAAGSWLDISPVVPEGKVFKGFIVYDEYGMFPNQQRVSTTTKEDTRFLMPNHDVYVKATYESLRYSLVVNSTDNGNVLITFNDRTRDRTKPGTKVIVTPNPSDGYTVESIVVSKKQDANISVECVKDLDRTDGSCSFDMPNFDVLVSANFVSLAELSSSSAVLVSSSSQEPLSSSSIVESSSSVAPVSSSAVVASSSSAGAPVSSSSAVPSSSSVVASSSSVVQSSSSVTPASSSSVIVSSSSAVPSSSSVFASSSSVNVSSSSAKPASSSSVKASSSSAKPVSSSSAKAASSSSKKASSSSAKPTSSSSKPSSSSAKSSSSIADVVVEAVATEEDLPSCTVKRENMTYYVSTLKAVFVCKGRMWNRYNPGPNALPMGAFTPKFSAVVKGRSLHVTGAKVGANVGLFDLQGRVIYNGRAESANFSMNVPQSGSFLLRVGTQHKIVNIH
ncbi:MAG: hypothetical protein IJM92_07795 [Fibrobacter sp.]|uniref:InlB B-repeat-containing protein n=1 Tax=Fibrobacter sp. TaxID=35828 RepID=UPI0025C6AF66|nr:hypothetical protein [Fibrobacter sp.]MBQ7079551.1 hypothetical protein [Fibrobacter sp.]